MGFLSVMPLRSACVQVVAPSYPFGKSRRASFLAGRGMSLQREDSRISGKVGQPENGVPDHRIRASPLIGDHEGSPGSLTESHLVESASGPDWGVNDR